MNKNVTNKIKLSNFSLVFQIVFINLFIIIISFIVFGILNFYITSKNFSLESKKIEVMKLGAEITTYIVNNAIESQLFTTQVLNTDNTNNLFDGQQYQDPDPITSRTIDRIQTISSIQDLNSYKLQKILELYYRDKSSKIKIYNSSSNLVASNNLVFSQYSISIESLDSLSKDRIDIYKDYKNFYTNNFVKIWHLYSKNKHKNILKTDFNEKRNVSKIIKDRKLNTYYYNNELDNSIEIFLIHPLIKENSVYGAVVINDTLRNQNQIIAELSFNLFNGLVILLIFVVLISIFYSSSIVGPIKRLSSIANKYKVYNPENSLEKNFPERGDEIGYLSKKIQEMSEELFSRINELERLTADLAHELKNPLASIKSANEILKNDQKSINDYNKMLLIIDKDIVKMNKLITDFSNYTKTKAEIERFENENVQINDLLDEIVNLYQKNKKNINFLTDFIDKKCITVGNYEKLVQVLTNLFDNAISFSPNNSSILITSRVNNDNFFIYIHDQGLGIDMKYKDKVFERFYTDRAIDSDLHSGLGLDISRHIVETYNGKIYLTNKKRKNFKGACFVVELPLKD